MYCNKCGHPNQEGSSFCSKCGNPMFAANQPASTYALATGVGTTSSENRLTDSFDEEAWCSVMGPKNSDYYLRRFRTIANGGPAPRWHWPACLVTWYWLIYRKMWGLSFLYLFSPYVLAFAVGGLIAGFGGSERAMAVLPLLLMAVFFTVPPLFANGWYFRHCQKVMAKIRAQTNSREAYLAALTVKGGSGGAAIIVIGTALVAIAIIGILAAVALPAYQDYTKRAKVADAMVMGRTTAQAVVEFYRQTREIPSRLEDLPGAPAMSPSVSEVSIDPNSGQVRLLVKDVGTLLMTPSVNGSEVIVSCTAADVKKSWLPASCRD
jgi:hypothetical protein